MHWFVFLSRFPKITIKPNEPLAIIVMPSPPETIICHDNKNIEIIINAINNCEKHFSGFSFLSGWLIHIRYQNQSYIINETSIRCGSRIWRIDIDTYQKLSQLLETLRE